MGFSVADTALCKWLAKKSQKNKIKGFQKAIDKLNEALDCIAQDEKECLELADKTLQWASQFPEEFQGPILERKKLYELHAKESVVMRPTVIAELVSLEKLKKIEVDALHNGDFITHWSFLFY
ncbi:unnamed protein product [Eruca vesicaria subsp. sativa]|uniref:Uncharacterized protein n=1 Tax=Eruca vesicaria subsp. sativa TaxID=29727 RepID=A0ABC8K975_ERUVS|nr:unnamed protein product [Eruca vesicaria subsp. sativa]